MAVMGVRIMAVMGVRITAVMGVKFIAVMGVRIMAVMGVRIMPMMGVRQHGRILGTENFIERNCGSVAEKGMSGARESERGAERLCRVNDRILGEKGDGVRCLAVCRGRGGETYFGKIYGSKEAGKNTEGS